MNKKFLVPAVVAFSARAAPPPPICPSSRTTRTSSARRSSSSSAHPSRMAADRAQFAVLAEISRQSRILSSWDSTSEFSQWVQSHGQPVRVSRELFDVLGLFDQWRVRTHGALDPSAQAVISAWTSAAAHQRVPTADELAAALSHGAAAALASERGGHDGDASLQGAARARVVHQELHHRSRGRRRPCACPASTPSSSTSAATSWCAARSRSRSTSPIRKTMRRTERRSRRSSFVTARSRRAATTDAASTSRASTTRTSSIRAPACRPAT